MRRILNAIIGQRDDDQRARRYRDIIRREAALGGQLFGPVPQGGRREFFCLNEHTWVWHEEWTDAAGQRHAITTRYDVRPHGIFKAQDGQPYRPLSSAEAKHFFKATRLYYKAVSTELYGSAQYLEAIA